jgi:hypothetical protein
MDQNGTPREILLEKFGKIPPNSFALRDVDATVLGNPKAGQTPSRFKFVMNGEAIQALVFIVTIDGDTGIYFNAVFAKSMMPEPMTQEDYESVQRCMSRTRIKSCHYLIYSTKFNKTRYVKELIFDPYYIVIMDMMV